MAPILSVRIDQLTEKVEKLETHMLTLLDDYARHIEAVRIDLGRALSEQREELLKLKHQVESDKQDSEDRRVEAIAQLIGE